MAKTYRGMECLKIKHWFARIPDFATSIYELTRLAWQVQPRIFVSLILLQGTQGFLPLGTAWITKQIFDLLVQSFQNDTTANLQSGLIPLLAVQALLTLFSQMIGVVNSYLNTELTRKLTLKTQFIVYKQIISLEGLAYFEDPKFHDMIRLASQGVQMGPSRMLNTLTSALHNTIMLMSFLGILLYTSPVLAGVVMVASLPQLYVQFKVSRQRFGMMYTNSPKERRAFYFGNVLSSIHFVKELRLFSLSNFFLGQFMQATQEVQSIQRQQQLREMRWQFGLAILAGMVSSSALMLIILQAYSGYISLGDVTLYIGALSTVQGALTGLIFAFAGMNENVLFFSHFTNLMALSSSISITTPPRSVPPLQSGIELRNVSFRYSQQHPSILENVSLFIPKGKCLALVGLNGAGKTTLVKLLTRLYDPTQGQILWDGIDIREFEPKEFRERLGAVFQDFVHYDLTAQENIGLGNVAEINNLERIKQAAKKVAIHHFIEDLPAGYKTVLSRWLVENDIGTDLSGGQWQKIAIARMFMREADFLILDEPTSSLDAQAEYEIYSHFVELINGRTSLLISHRFSTVRIADIIAVLEDGKITESGSHIELLAMGKTYAKLYAMQAEQYM